MTEMKKLATEKVAEGQNHIARLKELQARAEEVERKLAAEKAAIAVKHDTNKVRLELLSVDALNAIAEVMTFGAKKYADHNWRKGFAWSRLVGAALRHIFAWMRGENKDPESGLSHLAHAGCCIMFLLEHEIQQLGQDDRYKTVPAPKDLAQAADKSGSSRGKPLTNSATGTVDDYRITPEDIERAGWKDSNGNQSLGEGTSPVCNVVDYVSSGKEL
jgi:hypothetical protein